MARGSKKGRLYTMFKSTFGVTFYYKPSEKDGDVYYYIILDDVVRVSFRLRSGNVIVIHEVRPLTLVNLDPVYLKLFHLLVNQTEYSVLIDMLGNTFPMTSICISRNVPTVEDDRFTMFPGVLYEKFKEYYQQDESRYGFYLLAASDEELPEDDIDSESLSVLNHLRMLLSNAVDDPGKVVIDIITDSCWTIQCLGVEFGIDVINHDAYITNMRVNKDFVYMDLVTLFNVLSDAGKQNKIVMVHVLSEEIMKLIKAFNFQKIQNQLLPDGVLAPKNLYMPSYGNFIVTSIK